MAGACCAYTLSHNARVKAPEATPFGCSSSHSCMMIAHRAQGRARYHIVHFQSVLRNVPFQLSCRIVANSCQYLQGLLSCQCALPVYCAFAETVWGHEQGCQLWKRGNIRLSFCRSTSASPQSQSQMEIQPFCFQRKLACEISREPPSLSQWLTTTFLACQACHVP